MRTGGVEVVVALAGDLLDVFQVPAGTTCWVGTTAIPAVAGFEATIGLLTVTVSAAARPRGNDLLPRPPTELRPYFYGAASLITQLAIVVMAFRTRASEPEAPPATAVSNGPHYAVRIKRFATPAQTTERTADPAPTETPITADETPDEAVDRDARAQQRPHDLAPSEMPGGDLETVDPHNSGGASKFDPAANPAFDAIKVGDYSTVSTGRTAGAGYGPEGRHSSLVVITCDSGSCLVLGGEKAVRVRKAVDEHLAEITDCYKRAAMNGGGKVEIDFQVDTAGTVDDLEVGDADPAGTCVAKILRRLKIDADHETAS